MAKPTKKKDSPRVYVNDQTGKALVVTPEGWQRSGHVRIRPVYCGKKCSGCPHKFYKYVQWKEEGKVKEKYIGVVKQAA